MDSIELILWLLTQLIEYITLCNIQQFKLNWHQFIYIYIENVHGNICISKEMTVMV